MERSVVFRKTEPYTLSQSHEIRVPYWYAAIEGKECALIGPIESIPGNSQEPITYEEARRIADNIDWSMV